MIDAKYSLSYNGRAGSGDRGWYVNFALVVDGRPVGNNTVVRIGFGTLMEPNDDPPFAWLAQDVWVSVRDPLARHESLCREFFVKMSDDLLAVRSPHAWDHDGRIADITATGPALLT